MITTLVAALVLNSSTLVAHRLYSEGKFPEAAAAFSRTTSPHAVFNKGRALLDAGDYAGATEAFRAVDTAWPQLAADARFNLAHALYQSALLELQPQTVHDRLQPGNPDTALKTLRASATAFRSVLEINPDDHDAARNTEIIRRIIAQLQDELERQRQQQQQMQDAANRMDQLADTQQQQADETRSTPPSRARQQLEIQQDLNEQTQQAMADLEELLDQHPELREQLEQAIESQRDATEELAVNRTDRAAPHQQDASDSLRDIADALRQAASEKQHANQQHESEDQPQSPQESPDPAHTDEPKSSEQRFAEQVLEQERQQRRELENLRRMLSRPIPVERDW